MIKTVTFILVFLLLHSDYLFSEGLRQNQEYRANAVKTKESVALDGVADESIWKNAPRYELKYDTNPGDNAIPKAKTEFSTARDDDNLYFVFYCYDNEPEQVRAHLTERDRIFNDDFVLLIIDAFKDNQRVYEFAVNPFGVQGDLLRMGNNEDDSYDALWNSAGKRTDFGYVVEIGLPFKSLRFPTDNSSEWGLQVLRIHPRDSRYIYSWTPNDRNNPCLMCQAGVLTGMENIKTKTSYEVLPYIAGFQKSQLKDSDFPEKGLNHNDLQGRVGMSVKVTQSSELVLEGVVNPDFSQIESDAQQISVNSSFALFYPEKRPFFLEGAEIFSTYMTTFYSRMINNPLFALKGTGKKGKLSYALLTAQDRNSVFIVPGEEGSNYVETNDKSFVTIGRLRYDFGNDTYIGGISTSRVFNNAYNALQGIDFNYLFLTNYYLKGQFLFSKSKELNNLDYFDDSRKFGRTKKDAAFNGEELSGTAFKLGFARYTTNHNIDIVYRDVSPAFEGQSGFINATDSRSINTEYGYALYPDSTWITQVYLFANYGMRWNHESVQKERYSFVGGNIQLKGQVYINFNYLPLNDEHFRGKHFSNIHRGFVSLFTRPLNSLAFEIWWEQGHYIYRDDVPEMGKGHYAGSSINLRISEKLQSNFVYNRARLSAAETDDLYYDLYILRNVSSLQFTPEFNLRLITEYNSSNNNLSIFPLASYKINPFTIFYIGATSQLEKFDGHKGLIQSERQLFAKIQYLWNS